MILNEMERKDLKLILNMALAHYRSTLGEDCGMDEGEVKMQILRIEEMLAQIEQSKGIMT